MATVNVNTALRTFENSGVLKINNGTDDLVVGNIVPGTLKVTLPRREQKPYTDRGVQQTPVMGDDTLGELSVDLRLGKKTGSEILAQLGAANASGVAVKTFTVTIDVPDYRSATTGERFTSSNAFLMENLTSEEGSSAEAGKLSLKMGFTSGSWSAY